VLSRTKPRHRMGFTLLEIMVVVAIIAALAAVVAPSLFQNVGDAKSNAARAQIQAFALALGLPDDGTGPNRTALASNFGRSPAELARAISAAHDSSGPVEACVRIPIAGQRES
jgi:prepilin-type N-terminal cleavage/methylation domain-containing protein